MSLKSRTARSLKWNFIDRVATQVLYAVTGIVLARELSIDDFGLVGAILAFQAFASLLIDGGFSYALLQRKTNTRLGYSTVFWFNLGVAALLYILSFFCAPFIADFVQGDQRLIPLTRVLFLTLIINSTALVHINRVVKSQNVQTLAVANSLGLITGGVTGIALAVVGYGAWAIVFQNIVIGTVRSIVLWSSSQWRPLWRFSGTLLHSYLGIGLRMMTTSFLNTLFQNIYTIIIGNRAGLVPTGYYAQGDKWSKMGITSISQVFTSSFLPSLSAVQDDAGRYRRAVSKMNRLTAYLLFPATLGLAALATPIFHSLFGEKWDPAIMLFQLLLIRGIFTVLCSLYSNYLLALGHGNAIVRLEVLRDVAAIIALAVTIPYINLSTPTDPVTGIRIMLYGQLAAAFITWIASMIVTVRLTGISPISFCTDMAPYLAETLVIIPIVLFAGGLCPNAWIALATESLLAIALYLGINAAAGSQIQRDVLKEFKK